MAQRVSQPSQSLNQTAQSGGVLSVPPTVWALVAIAVSLLTWMLAHHTVPPIDPITIAVLVFLFCYVQWQERRDLAYTLPNRKFHITLSAPIYLVAGILIVPPIGVAFAMLSQLLDSLFVKREQSRTLTNVAAYGIGIAVGSQFLWNVLDGPLTSDILSSQTVIILIGGSILGTIAHNIVFAIGASSVLNTSIAAVVKSMLPILPFALASTPLLVVPLGMLMAINPLTFPFVLAPIFGLSMTARSMQRAQSQTQGALRDVADLLEIRERRTYNHSIRVENLVRRMLEQLPDINTVQGERIAIAARVHDLGKIGVPDRLLLKPAKLTDDEYVIMQDHVRLGANLVERLDEGSGIATIVLHHHEHWNGRGYPHGLAGDQIPIGSQLIAVADAFDAMCDDRPYRAAISVDDALAEVRSLSGEQFSPLAVAALAKVVTDGYELEFPPIEVGLDQEANA